jgi:hypothetical protein
MDDRKWEKLAALGGVAFVVLNIVGSITQGAPPSGNDTNDEVLAWFADHDTGIKVAVLLGGLSIIGLSWWFGSLWRRMSLAENGNHRLSVVALGGLVGGATLFLASTAVLTTVAIQVDEVSADAAFFFVLDGVVLGRRLIVTHLAAVSVLSLHPFPPPWLVLTAGRADVPGLDRRHHDRRGLRDDLRVHRLHRVGGVDPRRQRAPVAHRGRELTPGRQSTRQPTRIRRATRPLAPRA